MRSRVSLQLDGELSRFEALLVERHLGRCAVCAAFAGDVRTSTELLRAAPLEPAPPLWLPRLAPARHLATRVAAVSAAAAAAVLVAVSTIALQHRGSYRAAGFGLWPTAGAIHPRGDGNLGVRHHVSFEPGGPRRGLRVV